MEEIKKEEEVKEEIKKEEEVKAGTEEEVTEVSTDSKGDSKIKDTEEGIDIFTYLMDKHGVAKVLADVQDATEKQKGGFYKFTEGKQDILMVVPPKSVRMENAQFTDDGRVIRCVIKEIDANGNVLDIKYPLTLTDTRFSEIVGQIKALFPEWTPLIDPTMDIAKDLKFTATTGSWTTPDGELRTKTRFAIIKDDNFVRKTLWIKEKINVIKDKEAVKSPQKKPSGRTWVDGAV